MTKLFTVYEVDEILNKVKEYFADQEYNVKESSKKYKLQAQCSNNEADVLIDVKVEKVDENVKCIRVKKVCGAKMEFLSIFNEIKNHLTEAEMIIQ